MTFSLVACKENEGIDGKIKEIKYESTEEFSQVDLVKDGACNYVIVYSQTDTELTPYAVTELVNYFAQATSIELTAMTDEEYIIAGGSKPFISVGRTALFLNAEINYGDVKLGASGYVIKRADNNLFIYGNGYFGNLYGVYEFMHRQFGLEFYSVDETFIQTNVSNIKLKDFSLIDIPDAEYRVGGNGDIAGYSGIDHMRHMRMMSFGDVYAGSWNEGDIVPFHNTLEFITKEEYQQAHPEWFSPDGTQLCLTRDPEGLMQAVVEKMIAQLIKHPTRNIITFTQMDGPTWCSHCMAEYKETHSDSGDSESESVIPTGTGGSNPEKEYYSQQNILFVSELAKRIKAWSEQNCPERDIIVYLFHYGMTAACPVKTDSQGNPVKDENGNYIRFEPTIHMFDGDNEIAENFGVLFCSSLHTTYTGSYDANTNNIDETLKRWSTLSNKFSYWAYSTHFTNYFVPYDSVQQMQDCVQLAIKYGVTVFYNMAQYDSGTPTDWGVLESYLQSKLAWNSKADTQKLIDDFFEHYYKDASASMKKLYNAYSTYMAYLATERNIGAAINTSTSLEKEVNWPYKTLCEFLKIIDEAYSDIEPLAVNNPELYKKLHDRINLESFTFRYMIYDLYPDKFDYDELEVLKQKLISEAQSLGVSLWREGMSIDGLF